MSPLPADAPIGSAPSSNAACGAFGAADSLGGFAAPRGSDFGRLTAFSVDFAAFCFGADLAGLGFGELFADAFGCTLRFEGFAKVGAV